MCRKTAIIYPCSHIKTTIETCSWRAQIRANVGLRTLTLEQFDRLTYSCHTCSCEIILRSPVQCEVCERQAAEAIIMLSRAMER